ncbi:unnamed protein product [Phaedon cochleariae]|uniref:Myb/SANT-like DNA-binding domain-containing protein n=1 Tax=Phaedon cochleariae TaxID=80249 RepID=A0A9P0GWE7_PHACE|nr:unnamed protein product [Phaedon cochleariae]
MNTTGSEVGESFHFVNITHQNGVKFRVRLRINDIDKANADPVFLEELAERYYKLYQKNLITPIFVPEPEPNIEYDMDTVEDIENFDPVSSENLHDTFNEIDEYSVAVSSENLHDTFNEIDEYSIELSAEDQAASPIVEQRYIWSRDAVLLLLDELLKRKDNLQQPHKKRILFGEIAGVLKKNKYKVTWESCERKWRGLQTMYKKKKSIENKSGRGAVQWDYFEKVEEIIAFDPAYNPMITAAVGAETVDTARTVKKKSQTSTKDWLEKSFKETNNNIRELKETFNDFKQVQVQRNSILDRVATALEKLTD